MQLLGYASSTATELPIAVFRQPVASSIPPGTLWCADPVSMQVDRDSAVLLPPDLLHITADEAQQLIEALNRHFIEDGLRFSAQTPRTWVLHSITPLQLQTTELGEVIGQDVRNYSPRGDDARNWRRIGNEIEMLLFNHPVNQHREAQQQWPITGVWLWGGGARPGAVQSSLDVIHTDDDNVAAIAQSLALPTHGLPPNLHRFDWSVNQTIGMMMLLSIDAKQLLQLEAHWFVPLLAALRAGTLQQLTIHTRQRQFTLTRGNVRRWWRRRRNLAHWCQHG